MYTMLLIIYHVSKIVLNTILCHFELAKMHKKTMSLIAGLSGICLASKNDLYIL